MFFIRAGRFIAWAMVVLGFMRFVMGWYVALAFDGDRMFAASRRYLGAVSSGEAIDQGLFTFIAGVVLGLLVQIAQSSVQRH